MFPFSPTSFLRKTWPLLSKALGLMALSSLVRGLSALVPAILASVIGAGTEMDQYMAFLTVTAVVCAISATPFANIVSREIASNAKKYRKGHNSQALDGATSGSTGRDALKHRLAYGKPVKRVRQWAQRVGNWTLLVYLPLSAIAALALSHQSSPVWQLWALLLLGAPSVMVATRISVEQALLQARGKPYLAILCSSLFSASCLLGALLLLIPAFRGAGTYLCAAAVSAGSMLELWVTKNLVCKKQEQRVAGSQAPSGRLPKGREESSLDTALDVEPADLAMGALPAPLLKASLVPAISRKDAVPWQDFFILAGASAGALMSGFFDQGLMSHMGPSVQAYFGLASRIPSFLALSIFAAGSMLAAMLLANQSTYSPRQLRIRILELFLLVLGLSVGVAALLWWRGSLLTDLIYVHGTFSAADAAHITQVLPFAALAYLPYPASAVLMRCAAVQAGPRTLLWSSGLFLLVKLLVGIVGYVHWGLAAIAASSLAAYSLQCAILWWALIRKSAMEQDRRN